MSLVIGSNGNVYDNSFSGFSIVSNHDRFSDRMLHLSLVDLNMRGQLNCRRLGICRSKFDVLSLYVSLVSFIISDNGFEDNLSRSVLSLYNVWLYGLSWDIN
jgi:hypothetical protein